jgi:hypothetical protein
VSRDMLRARLPAVARAHYAPLVAMATARNVWPHGVRRGELAGALQQPISDRALVGAGRLAASPRLAVGLLVAKRRR